MGACGRFAVLLVLTTMVVSVIGTSGEGSSALQLVNEGWPLPSGLTVQLTAGGTTTLFTSAGPGPSPYVQLPASALAGTPVTLTLVNVSSGKVAGQAVRAAGFDAGHDYIVFVSSVSTAAAAGGHSLAAAVLPSLPSPTAWPAQRTDVALFRVLSADLSHPLVSVNTTSSNCWQCLAVFRALAVASSNDAPAFMTAAVPHDYVVALSSALPGDDTTELFRASFPWNEAGVYTLVLPAGPRGGAAQSYVVVQNHGNNVAVPLLVWAGVLLGLVLVYNAGRLLVPRLARASSASQRANGRASPTPAQPPSLSSPEAVHVYADGAGVDDLAQHGSYSAAAATSKAGGAPQSIKPGKRGRVVAIDTFRGMALCIMIFVNYGGGGYWFFNHSWWNGLTVADLVFPWFVWIMGTSMAISHSSARRKGMSTGAILAKVLVRSAKLFSIGLFLNNGYVLKQWRVLGVLQYFAISGLVVALIAQLVPELRCGKSAGHGAEATALFNDGYGAVPKARGGSGPFADILPYALQWCCVFGLLTVYLCIQFLLDVPGCGRGYIGPGGNGNFGLHRGCTGGAHGYIDHLIFGSNHMYHNVGAGGAAVSAATCAGETRYDCNVYDPEGTLGYLTCSVICFLGLQAGRVLVTHKGHRERVTRWVVWGVVLCAIGTALCGASQNDGVIPLSKNVWSPSFILVMAGTGNLVLAVTYVLVDINHWWGGAPPKFVGMNSIVVYAGSEILQMYFPFTIMVDTPVVGERGLGLRSHSAALAANTIGVATWLLIAWLMARNKVFINV